MSWMTDFTFALLYPELVPPADWTINTLSEMDLTGKLEWCKTKKAEIEQKKLYGDEYVLAGELLEWLNRQIALLQHWLDTLPGFCGQEDQGAITDSGAGRVSALEARG